MRVIPRILALAIIALGLALTTMASFLIERTEAQGNQPLVLLATVDGPITPVVARYIDRAIDRADDRGASALVIELNTPGGLGSAMDDIVDDIVASNIPVVVYVAPTNARAASAGVFITYAAHIAVMAPSTNIGSASPILTGSTGSLVSDDRLERKVMNDAIARITNLANLRGRNVDWAISAVRDAANITADEALTLGVINLIEPNLNTLLTDIDGQQVQTAAGPVTLSTAGAHVDKIDLSILEELLQLLANPTLAYLLVSFGMLLFFIELSQPGIGMAAAIGFISLMLGLVGLGSLPVAWVGVGFMGLAFVLFIVDIFVPSLGMITVAGLVSFLIGSNILFADGTPTDLKVPRPIVWTMTLCLAGAAALLGMAVIRNQFKPTKTGKAGMVGRVGVVRTRLDPEGSIMVFGENWAATAPENRPIEVDDHVVVESVRKLRVFVRPATQSEIEAERNVSDRRAVVPVR